MYPFVSQRHFTCNVSLNHPIQVAFGSRIWGERPLRPEQVPGAPVRWKWWTFFFAEPFVSNVWQWFLVVVLNPWSFFANLYELNPTAWAWKTMVFCMVELWSAIFCLCKGFIRCFNCFGLCCQDFLLFICSIAWLAECFSFFEGCHSPEMGSRIKAFPSRQTPQLQSESLGVYSLVASLPPTAPDADLLATCEAHHTWHTRLAGFDCKASEESKAELSPLQDLKATVIISINEKSGPKIAFWDQIP